MVLKTFIGVPIQIIINLESVIVFNSELIIIFLFTFFNNLFAPSSKNGGLPFKIFFKFFKFLSIKFTLYPFEAKTRPNGNPT